MRLFLVVYDVVEAQHPIDEMQSIQHSWKSVPLSIFCLLSVVGRYFKDYDCFQDDAIFFLFFEALSCVEDGKSF
jgi:hypothetical protein